MRLLFLLKRNPKNCMILILGDKCFLYSTAKKWRVNIQHGDFETQNAVRSGGSSTATYLWPVDESLLFQQFF